MCLILVAWQAHPRFPLVVAANRDEWYARPADPAQFWDDAPDVIAGRDRSAGGTWLGLTRGGRFAALTNYRGATSPRINAPSRGSLVARYLMEDISADAAASAFSSAGMREYNGFNLLFGDGRELQCYSNVTGESRRLAPGIYGLSNEFLDTPWPKVEKSKSALAAALDSLPDERALFHLLRDDSVFPEHLLPATGVEPAWERLLSAAFVRGADYGTRCSTVLMIDTEGQTLFDEQTWLENAAMGPRRRFRFRVGK